MNFVKSAPDFLQKLFPFHFIIDMDLKVVSVGRSMQQFCSGNSSFSQVFKLVRPGLGIKYSFESIREFRDQIFILQLRDELRPYKFKGQFVLSDDSQMMAFCGSPWVTSEASLVEMKVNIADFALHDSVIDMLHMITAVMMERQDNKTLTDEIARQKDFYQALWDNIPVDLTVIDTDQKFRYVNKSAVRNPEVREWLIGRTISEYLSSRSRSQEFIEQRQAYLNKALLTGENITYTDSYNENTVNEKIMLRSLFPFLEPDGRKSIIGYGLDVTEIMKSRAELEKKNSELEKLNHELDTLIYSLTHDLRSPILSVIGLTDITLQHANPSDEIRNYVSMMRNSMVRLDDTIKEIMTYSRNLKTKISFTEINIPELVDAAFAGAQHYVTHEVHLTQNLSVDSPLYSDKIRLQSVINNLVTNAVKYSRKDSLSAFVKVFVSVTAEQFLLRVEDNGEGIPIDQQGKVFEMFHRASNNSTGSGLGLFICSEIVRKLGGQIKLESVPLKGSTFTVTIPNTPI